MIPITPSIALPEKELKFQFIRASGPGGQNVNKVATAVQLRLDVRNCLSLPAEVRDRLLRLGGQRITAAGELIIEARRFRTQERNRQDAIERLVTLLQQAARRPKLRRKTTLPPAVRKRRLDDKRRRGAAKRLRGDVSGKEWDG